MNTTAALLGSIGLVAALAAGCGDDTTGTGGGTTSTNTTGAGGDAATTSTTTTTTTGAGGAAMGCGPGTPSCLHAEGTHDGEPFDFTCTGGRTGFNPMALESPVLPDDINYQAVCGDGVMNGGLGDTFTVQLLLQATVAADLTPGTYTWDTPGMTTVGNHGLTLQVTKTPAKQVELLSPNFAISTVTITEHTVGTLIAGTFSGTWGPNLTVDLHSGSWKHLCGAWTGNGCDTGLGMDVPQSCVCSAPPALYESDVTGSFRFTF